MATLAAWRPVDSLDDFGKLIDQLSEQPTGRLIASGDLDTYDDQAFRKELKAALEAMGRKYSRYSVLAKLAGDRLNNGHSKSRIDRAVKVVCQRMSRSHN